MLRVTVSYPNAEGSRFDLEYYKTKHIPMVRQCLGTALQRDELFLGAGTPVGGAAAFRIVLHMFFESADAFGKAFAPNAKQIMSDVRNYTDVEPLVQLENPG